jgi:hypothetical protein
VVKHRRKGRVVKVAEKIVFGTSEMLQDYLDRSPVSRHLNTAFVERQNGTMRHQNRRSTRRAWGFSKEDDWMERQKWREVTPAMSVGITDHKWTLEELLTFRVTPIDSTVKGH